MPVTFCSWPSSGWSWSSAASSGDGAGFGDLLDERNQVMIRAPEQIDPSFGIPFINFAPLMDQGKDPRRRDVGEFDRFAITQTPVSLRRGVEKPLVA
jgi:hypothetical protein